MKRLVLISMSICGCLALDSQVDDSPPWCFVTWMFCLPLVLVDSYNSILFAQIENRQLSGISAQVSKVIGAVWKSKVRVQESC